MKMMYVNKRVVGGFLAVILSFVILFSLGFVRTYAEELPEEVTATETETDSVSGSVTEIPEAEVIEASAVIHVRAWAGTKAVIETYEGSPEPDRSEFTCVGNREKDYFTVTLTEPGNYEYKLKLGTEEFVIKVAGIYEDTEAGEEFVAYSAIVKSDGTKTDEPNYTPPTDTPFGIGDTPAGPFLFIIGFIGVVTLIGVLVITKRKERA